MERARWRISCSTTCFMPPAYRSLVAWQRADDLFFRVHEITKKQLPKEERYELTSQIRRAALSVPTNIVEGTARFNSGERVQFLRTSWASLIELGYLLYVAERLQYLSAPMLGELETDIRRAAAPLRGLILKAKSETRAPATPSLTHRLVAARRPSTR
jgi:four helix bundle protein